MHLQTCGVQMNMGSSYCHCKPLVDDEEGSQKKGGARSTYEFHFVYRVEWMEMGEWSCLAWWRDSGEEMHLIENYVCSNFCFLFRYFFLPISLNGI